jgi:hypothetical protein
MAGKWNTLYEFMLSHEDTWEEFSKNSPKYHAYGRVWNRMKQGGLGIGTMRTWDEEANPTTYPDIIEDVSTILNKNRGKTHNDVARAVFSMFQHIYIYSCAKKMCWYEFKNHRWQVCEGGITLRQRLSEEVSNIYHLEAIKYNSKAVVADTVADQNQYGVIAANFNDIAMRLRNRHFKENIMKECTELFYVSKFEDRLDADTNLIGFENGVYDLEGHVSHINEWVIKDLVGVAWCIPNQ